MKRKELIKSETKSIYMANFLVVLFSVLSALIIGTALSSIDYGGNPSISTYIGMFLAQFFIVVPVILLLKRNNLNIAKSLRINRVSKRILFYSLFCPLVQ